MGTKTKATKPVVEKGGEVVSKTRVTHFYTEYVVKGEGFKAVIQAADYAYEVGQTVSIK